MGWIGAKAVIIFAVQLMLVGLSITGPTTALAQIGGSESAEERRLRLEQAIEAAREHQAAEAAAAEQRAAEEAAEQAEAERAAAEKRRAAQRAAAQRRKAEEEAAEQARLAAEAAAAREAATKVPYATFRDCPECPELVRIPAGSFRMGNLQKEDAALTARMADALRGVLGTRTSTNLEVPVRTVQVPSFSVGRHEVTFDQWDACLADGGCGGYRPPDLGWGRGARPVINVSWGEAQIFVEWLSARTGRPYRLLSEAEWEYVTRAGTDTRYSFGEAIDCAKARYGQADGDCGSARESSPVGSFEPNPWGLFDVHGNVWEWVADCHNPSLDGAPTDARARGDGDCTRRMYRGGAWSSVPDWLRSSFRGDDNASVRYHDLGLRVARDD